VAAKEYPGGGSIGKWFGEEIRNCDDPTVQQFILGHGDGPIKSLE